MQSLAFKNFSTIRFYSLYFQVNVDAISGFIIVVDFS